MTNNIKDYYENEENCFRELSLAREIWSKPETTNEQFEKLAESLGFMYVYCNPDIQYIVLSTMQELEQRRFYRMFLRGK